MKTKIFLFIAGLLFFVSCSEEFITIDLDKSSYDPGTFFTTKAKADQALVGAYTSLRDQYGQTWGGSTLCTWLSVTTFTKLLKQQVFLHGAL